MNRNVSIWYAGICDSCEGVFNTPPHKGVGSIVWETMPSMTQSYVKVTQTWCHKQGGTPWLFQLFSWISYLNSTYQIPSMTLHLSCCLLKIPVYVVTPTPYTVPCLKSSSILHSSPWFFSMAYLFSECFTLRNKDQSHPVTTSFHNRSLLLSDFVKMMQFLSYPHVLSGTENWFHRQMIN